MVFECDCRWSSQSIPESFLHFFRCFSFIFFLFFASVHFQARRDLFRFSTDWNILSFQFTSSLASVLSTYWIVHINSRESHFIPFLPEIWGPGAPCQLQVSNYKYIPIHFQRRNQQSEQIINFGSCEMWRAWALARCTIKLKRYNSFSTTISVITSLPSLEPITNRTRARHPNRRCIFMII